MFDKTSQILPLHLAPGCDPINLLPRFPSQIAFSWGITPDFHPQKFPVDFYICLVHLHLYVASSSYLSFLDLHLLSPQSPVFAPTIIPHLFFSDTICAFLPWLIVTQPSDTLPLYPPFSTVCTPRNCQLKQ